MRSSSAVMRISIGWSKTRRNDALIGTFPSDGDINFVTQFARPLPQQVMAEVLGFPDTDIPQLAAWDEAQVMPFVYGEGHLNRLADKQLAAQFAQLEGFKEYVQEIVSCKRRTPAEDMISFLTQVKYSALDRKLSDLEINGIAYAMVLGGLETTQYALDQQAQLIC